jgi:thiol:disulfide interchange protein
MPPADGATPAGSTRRTPRALLLLAGVLLVARVVTGLHEERHPPQVPERIHWRPLAEAATEARAMHRPILYDFTADWCPPCRAMQREVFADRASAEQIERMFVPVRVLDRQREEGRNPAEVDTLQARYHITSFPTLVVSWPDSGRPVVLAGYRGKANTLQRLTEAMMHRMGGRGTIRFP